MYRDTMTGVKRRIVWRVGGLRSASVGSAWKPEEGWTGFVDGRRWIEEPNRFSILGRKLFALECQAHVDGEDHPCVDYESMMDAIIHAGETRPKVFVTWFLGSMPVAWALIDPHVRITPREVSVWMKNDMNLISDTKNED